MTLKRALGPTASRARALTSSFSHSSPTTAAGRLQAETSATVSSTATATAWAAAPWHQTSARAKLPGRRYSSVLEAVVPAVL